MKRFRPIPLAATLWLAWTLGACAGEAPDSAPASEAEVEFEPAYPEEVSSEELTEADAAQQETHTHGGTTHAHGDEGDDEHEHDDGSHSH